MNSHETRGADAGRHGIIGVAWHERNNADGSDDM